MKKILFFDRCDLTRLFIFLTKELSEDYNIVHVAFSQEEENQLKEAGIEVAYNLQGELAKTLDSCALDLQKADEIDRFIIKESKGVFSFNAAIQADRGYVVLNNNEAMHLAQSYYMIWKKIFDSHHVDLMFHEPSSLFMVYIASLLCKKQGGQFYYMQQSGADVRPYSFMFIDGENYLCPEFEKYYEQFKNNPDTIDVDRVKAYIDTFRKDQSVFMGNLQHATASRFNIYLNSLKYKIKSRIKGSKFDKLKDNINYWMNNSNNIFAERLYNLKHYKARGIQFLTSLPEGERFYYYPFHLEPEATVTYLGGGIYTNQVKLIENIAASIPPGTFLYVKDHPHEYAYRNAEDYYRLMQIPNIRLIHQSIPGKVLVNKAIGVFTINGTAGVEALMIGRKVYCFAPNFYSFYEGVKFIPNVKDIREIVYADFGREVKDDMNFYAYVNAYLNANHPGFAAYFYLAVESEIDEQENARNIAEAIRAI